MKKVDKIVTKYEAIDGILFDKESDALLHEGFLNGTVKKCDRCNGTGEVDPYGDGRVFITCSNCDGKGHVTKQEIWK